ncbi:MAG: EFR1 family ferrodoxin [Oscillospiraceae bacterium]|nr:EFR1 family ferrodoxin [Oscillospiraceae bacterium]
MLIFYFSGTGNSKYIAQLFAQNMNCACCSIEQHAQFDMLIKSAETIAFCYPVYFSRVPRIMREFVQKYMSSFENKKLIIFCTQHMFSGDGARAFYALFPKNYLRVIYAEHFFMPSNVTPVTTDDKKIKSYIKKAAPKMQKVCDNIKSGRSYKRGFNIASRALGLIQAPLLAPAERKACRDIKITHDCTLCGICVSSCPMQNLKIESGAVAHKNNCTVCYRCINKCPQKAINFFSARIKKQYYFKEELK